MVILYNCKRCKVGRRAEYVGSKRISATGETYQAGIWIQSCGGGRPTVYGGDVEMGICPNCSRMMSYGALEARISPAHKCDVRCTSARGNSCECSCGGRNHGADWSGLDLDQLSFWATAEVIPQKVGNHGEIQG